MIDHCPNCNEDWLYGLDDYTEMQAMLLTNSLVKLVTDDNVVGKFVCAGCKRKFSLELLGISV